jgi:Transcriptional Coactivator p15 (PC4)
MSIAHILARGRLPIQPGTQIDIREMYQGKASGELKPGLKGLVLTPDQWATLAAAMPAIDAALVGWHLSRAAVRSLHALHYT